VDSGVLMGRWLAIIRTFVRLATPYVLWVARQSLWLTALSFVSTLRGALDTSREIAEEWTETAIQRGMPMQFENWLRWLCRVVAFSMCLLGWILLAYLTVFVVGHLIF
jgi:hypothetical protein